MNLNQVTIAVSNLQTSIIFYQKLGLTLIVNSPENAYARFECPDGGSTFSLHEAINVTPAGTSLYFEVADVERRVAELKDQGLKFDVDPTEQRWLWHEAWTHDPDGYRIGIYHAGHNRRFPPWRIDRQTGDTRD